MMIAKVFVICDIQSECVHVFAIEPNDAVFQSRYVFIGSGDCLLFASLN